MKLLITNGDSTGDMLERSTCIEGEVLCWRDLLHDGPVLDLPYSEYSAARIQYLHQLCLQGINFQNAYENESCAAIDSDLKTKIADDFRQRAATLTQLNLYDEIILFFEHDLYDQLQLAEICHRLLEYPAQLPPISIICINNHHEIPYFHGLGQLSIPMLEALYSAHKHKLSNLQLKAGQAVWHALVASDPIQLSKMAQEPVLGWPFMQSALQRYCREYPAKETGLTLTQTYLLMTLLKAPDELPALEHHLKRLEQSGQLQGTTSAEQRYYEILMGPATFRRIFHHLQQLEEAPFMGNLSVKSELQQLIMASVPYVSGTEIKRQDGSTETEFSLTHEGAEALQGLRHWLDGNNYNCWRGAVNISHENAWEWCQPERVLVKRST